MRKHNVQSVRYVTSRDFDEQLWPINAMLFIFACCVGAVVVTAGLKEGRFIDPRTDPQPFYNAWMHLGFLGFMVVALLIGSIGLRRRVATRRMQLAVMLALLVQFLEIIGLYALPSAGMAEPSSSPWIGSEARSVTVPDYGEEVHKQLEEESIHQPDRSALTQQAQPTESQRMATESRQTGRSSDGSGPSGANEQAVSHDAQHMAATSLPSARPGGTLSRTDRQDRLNPEAALAPAAQATAQQNASRLDARTVPLQRQENSAQAQLQRRPSDQPATAADASSAFASIDRRQTVNPQAASSASSTTKSNTPENMASAAAASANPAAPAASAARLEARDARLSPSGTAPSRFDRTASESPATIASSSSTPAASQRAAMSDSRPTPQAAGQSIAKASTSAAATGAAPAATADSAQASGGAQAGSLSASSSTRREATGQTALSARGGAASPTAATQSPTFSATQLQRTTAGESRPGTASSSPQLARTSTTGGIPAAGSAVEAANMPEVTSGSGSTGGPRASQSASTRAQTGGQTTLANPSLGGGNIALPAEVGSPAATAQRVAGQAVPTASGRQGSSAPLAKANTGERSGIPDARADGPDVAMSAVQGGSPGLQSAPAGEGTGRSTNAAGSSSVGQIARSGSGGQPSSDGGAGSANAANLSRAGSGGNGEPTVASSGASTRSGKSSVDGLDGQAVAAAAGDGGGGGPATSQGIAGISAQGGNSGSSRGQTYSGNLGERNSVGGPAGGTGEGVTVGAANSVARAGGAGSQPQLGTTGRGMTKGTGPAAGGSTVAGSAADVSDGPATATSGTGSGPSARAAGRTAEGGTTGSPLGRATSGDVGPAGTETSSGLAGGPMRVGGGEAGPRAASAGAGSLTRSSTQSTLAGGADLADDAGPAVGAGGTTSGVGRLGPAASQPTRGDTNSVIVKSQAPDGPGGLNNDSLGQVGVPNRLALSSSDMVQPNPNRFQLNKTSGGGLTLDSAASKLPPGFETRDPTKRKADPSLADAEKAVEAGLDFLARHQSADGRWSLHYFAAKKDYRLPPTEELIGMGRHPDPALTPQHSDTAATGIALLAFLGQGYTHQQGKYKQVVAGGLQFLLREQKANGDLYSGNARYVWLYSHGIAAIAVCEAYGMTRDPALKEPAQKALDFIVAAQSDEGGWRYAPKVGSDTSVSGWMVMAIKSGQLAGLTVPTECLKKVERWLDSSHPQGDKSKYIYRSASNLEHQNTPSPTMTAEGLLMRLYLGWKPDQADLLRGADHLLEHLPVYRVGSRNSYYWYYATQLLVHVKGQRWTTWNERLKKLLIDTQESQGPLQGSWNPLGDVRDEWGCVAGRVYNTAIHCLILEAQYRKLPLTSEGFAGAVADKQPTVKTP